MTQNPKPITHNLFLRDRRAIIVWLSLCLFLVACMVMLGGYTRLSGSGLSITTWKPIHGIIPPLNDTQWQEEFTAYQASPQYQQVNKGMTMAEFQVIFWPEFIHRLLGRLIGMVFFLPLVIFSLRRSLSKRLTWRLAGIFVLGGLQGLIGWLMVKSGLVDAPQVSPVRLAAHLSTALAIFALLLWMVLDVVEDAKCQMSNVKYQKKPSFDICFLTFAGWFFLLCLQIVMGAFMAGLHGGLIYNTWPTMNGQWLPDGLWDVSPWYANITLIQFIHRNLAIFLAVSYIAAWLYARKSIVDSQLKKIATCVIFILMSQVILGIVTLLHHAPLALALTHQMAGTLLFAASVVLLHEMYVIRRVK